MGNDETRNPNRAPEPSSAPPRPKVPTPEAYSPPPAEPPPGTDTRAAGELTERDRNLAMWAHLSTLSTFIAIPGFIGPLLIWQVQKDDSPFASGEAKEALNFQISIYIAAFVTFLLCFVLIGFLLIPVVAIAGIALPIIAGIRASEGRSYRYPCTLRLF